jgi:hypothetical protein
MASSRHNIAFWNSWNINNIIYTWIQVILLKHLCVEGEIYNYIFHGSSSQGYIIEFCWALQP